MGQFSIRKGVISSSITLRISLSNSRLKVVGSVNPDLMACYDHVSINNIDFYGTVPRVQVHKYMNDAQALILPSFEDGFGMVVPQALACGIPAIVSAQCGASDIIIDGYNGFILDDISTQSIDLAIRRLFSLTPEQFIKMSSNCILSVKT